jgi:hypothetical protein
MAEIIGFVTKYGDSWVVKLDKTTRKLLKISEVGQRVIIKEDTAPEDLSTYT